MKNCFKTFIKSIPYTLGMVFTLLSLCFLVEFISGGLDLKDEEFWIFLILFVIGIPLILVGIETLSTKTPNKAN